MDERLVKLSRTMSYALRHHPEDIGLTLDQEGWVPVEDLLTALHQRRSWQDISEDDLVMVIAQSDKKRYEIQAGMIRASYGHSVPQKKIYEVAIPPEVLFHGTTPDVAPIIRKGGLKPMQRQYVHLSAEETMARTVALRRTQRPIILRINALQAHEQGIKFYDANDQVWLAESIPPQFIRFTTEE